MVLDHSMTTLRPEGVKEISERHRCLEGSNLCQEGGMRFDFLAQRKKANKKVVQRAKSRGSINPGPRKIVGEYQGRWEVFEWEYVDSCGKYP
jgi:hypothetical protein